MPRRTSNLQPNEQSKLDSRAEALLGALIKEHVITGEAVGSRLLSDRFSHGYGWSPATIRNVMADLEEGGLVEQPHTSAGRVPTDKGYRYYVDNMLGEARLSRVDLKAIDNLFAINADSGTSPDRFMETASHVLSALSQNVGIVVSPSLAENRLKHIEFVQLPDKRILVVLVSTSNIIHNKVIRLTDEITQDELDRTARYLNAEFGGMSLLAIRAEIVELMKEEKALYDQLLRNAVLLCERSLEGEEEGAGGEVYVDGTSNILTKPDFDDIERMRDLFRTFEEKSRLIKVLNECVSHDTQSYPGDVHVVIGREHPATSLRNCAVITAPYRMGSNDNVGTLGVVGPMRIEYARIMAMVNYMARLIEQRFGETAAN
jgi:heat-inducible transcriptional repressor